MGKHFDAFWQICWVLGCSFAKEYIGTKYEPLVYLTGRKPREFEGMSRGEIEDLKKEIENARKEKLEKAKIRWTKIGERQKKQSNKKISASSKLYLYWLGKEFELYEPLSKWLYGYLKKQYPKSEIVTYDTSKHYLSKFLPRNNLLDTYETYAEYDIKPDVVGFIKNIKEFAFIEAKIGAIQLKDIGQLLGYCYIAQPKEAFIISPKEPSSSLIKTLEFNKNLLKYSKDKYIKIGKWNDKNKTVEYIYPKNGK